LNLRFLVSTILFCTLFLSRTSGQFVPTEDCFTYTYRFQLGADNRTITMGKGLVDRFGVTYLTGTDWTDPDSKEGIIHKNDFMHTPLWTRAYSVPGKSLSIEQIDVLPDNDLIVIGTVTDPDGSNAEIYLSKIKDNGDLVWSQRLGANVYGKSISANRNGTFVFAGQSSGSIVVGNMRADGTLNWLRQSTGHSDPEVVGLLGKNAYMWTVAYNEVRSGRQYATLLQFDPATGNLQAFRDLGENPHSSDYIVHDIVEGNNRTHVTGIFRSGAGPYRFFEMMVASSEIEIFRILDLPGETVSPGARSSLSGTTSTISLITEPNSSNLIVIKTAINTSDPATIHWSKKWALTKPASTVHIIDCYDAGFLATAGQATPASGAIIEAVKTDSTGQVKN
jgi:hypothetical protein